MPPPKKDRELWKKWKKPLDGEEWARDSWKSKTHCEFYARGRGICLKGDKCDYLHEEEERSSTLHKLIEMEAEAEAEERKRIYSVSSSSDADTTTPSSCGKAPSSADLEAKAQIGQDPTRPRSSAPSSDLTRPRSSCGPSSAHIELELKERKRVSFAARSSSEPSSADPELFARSTYELQLAKAEALRSFRIIKAVIKLQAIIRGHLVRRHAENSVSENSRGGGQ